MQPVFDAVVQSAARLLAPANAALNVRDGGLIRLKGIAGLFAGDERRRYLEGIYPIAFDPAIGGAAQCMFEGRVFEVSDTESQDMMPRLAAMGPTIGMRSNIQIPLMREEQAIGTLSVGHPQAGFKLGEKRLALMKTFVDQAVIAIENVRLFKELEARTAALTRSVGQLTALGEVGLRP